MSYILALTILLAPAYVTRFNIFGVPTNLLMVWVVLVWLAFLVWIFSRGLVKEFLQSKKNAPGPILLFGVVLLLASIISLFVHGFDREKLGQWIVLFLQPISMFLIARFVLQKHNDAKRIIHNTLYFILAAAGLYAIIQYFTLLGLPPAWWGNSDEPKRAIAFFIHPNFYALFVAPLLAFLIPDVLAPVRGQMSKVKCSAWLLGAIGLFLSLSRAGWLGLAAAIAAFLIIAADRKTKKLILSAAAVVAIIIIIVPNLRWRVILPFYGEKSAGSRVELWQSGLRAVKTSPILGLGLNGYANNYQKFQTDPRLDTHNFPHNIFLDFWVETGILGMISFIGIAAYGIYRGLKYPMALPVALFLIALIFQGLIDNPYFKNDLALVFWMILAFV